jgi:hypothetical protein
MLHLPRCSRDDDDDDAGEERGETHTERLLHIPELGTGLWTCGWGRSNIAIHNSPSWTIHPYFSSNIHIHHVNITDDAPGNAHFNTDGP